MDTRKFTKKIKQNFVKRVWRGRKDWSHTKTFAAAPFPASKNWLTRILNQGGAPSCTAYTAVAIREAMTGKQYDPEAFWQAEQQMSGGDGSEGVTLDTQMAVGVKIGWTEMGKTGSSDNATGWMTVTPTKTWLNPNGTDMFDSIKQALAIAPLSIALEWYEEWDKTPQGIVPHTFNRLLGSHDTKGAYCSSTETVDGIEYLVIQGSWGEDYGDQGKFRFDRYMANRCFTEGVKYWIDSEVIKVKELGLLGSLLVQLWNLVGQIGKKNNGNWPPKPNPLPTPSKIVVWANAIASQEGANPKFQNPGNLKISDLTKSWGATNGFNATDGGVIARFPDYQTGFNALCQFLILGAENRLLAFHKARTLAEFTKIYAGNPPPNYLHGVCLALGVAPETDISTFLS